MFEIYRRFDNEPAANATVWQSIIQNNYAERQNPPLRLAPARQNNASGQQAHNQSRQNSVQGQPHHHNSQPQIPHHSGEQHTQQKERKKSSDFLKNLLPSSVYDPKRKKLFGIFAAEDILLVALIFLLLEKDDEDNLLMILALAYVLISEYIEIPGFEF